MRLPVAVSVTSADSFDRPGPRRSNRVLWGGLAILAIASFAAFLFFVRNEGTGHSAVKNAWKLPDGFSAPRAYGYLKEICDLGPRSSGSEGMRRQQELLTAHFERLGCAVTMQSFDTRDPETGERITMKNLIAGWKPELTERILLCAHYDTRPFPDRDPVNPRGRFVGANDGASGVAALLELAHQLPQLPGNLGVDIVLFDGEELVYRERRDTYFLGSTHFAQMVAAKQMPGHYQAGVLLDMVGDRDLAIFYEANSMRYARKECLEIWGQAKALKIDAFIPRSRHEIRDDHLPLNEIAKIPTVDLIDFDYPRPAITGQGYWHTMQDTPDKCSGESLAAVAAVVFEWLKMRSGALR